MLYGFFSNGISHPNSLFLCVVGNFQLTYNNIAACLDVLNVIVCLDVPVAKAQQKPMRIVDKIR